MTIDQPTQALLQTMAARGAKPLIESTPAEVRAAGVGAWEAYGPGPAQFSVVDEIVSTPDGGAFPVRVLVPSEQPSGTLIYYHGGGWVLGEIDGYDTLGRTLAAAANVTVVLVGYRLAPEHPFPTPVDDAWTALQWVHERVPEIAGRLGPVVLSGDSAGGNLSIVTALRACDEGPEISALLLVYPATDTDTGRASYLDPQNQLIVSKPAMEWFFDHYLGDSDRSDPRVSPLRATSLRGFPPTALVLAEHDPLLDEGVAFADRLRAEGIPVQQRLFEGQMHGFFHMVNVLPASAEAIDWLVDYLDEHISEIEGQEKA